MLLIQQGFKSACKESAFHIDTGDPETVSVGQCLITVGILKVGETLIDLAEHLAVLDGFIVHTLHHWEMFGFLGFEEDYFKRFLNSREIMWVRQRPSSVPFPRAPHPKSTIFGHCFLLGTKPLGKKQCPSYKDE